ncbi:hypothetical protein DYB28_001890 [Aphanomyces astaci]|uniref:Potassium channel domain-containing protein n=1 Tax=Aphanomyces astaci TaxID=112090 RepID=A0A9X8DKH2_APHAT|nr:hypothetical protein DYB28_001890 [Aphanomyces astaci]
MAVALRQRRLSGTTATAGPVVADLEDMESPTAIAFIAASTPSTTKKKGSDLMAMVGAKGNTYEELSDPSSRELTLFRVFRVFRALRVLRLHNLIRSRKHGYNYEWGVFVFSLSAIIFVAAGIFHALEDYPSRDRRLQFHDSLYYILVTLSTIGYGDIVPTRPLTEFFVMGLIIVVVTTVPAQIARLHALHVSIHAYDGAYVCRPGRGHVIVCGHVVHDSFADFLTEFYHPSRGVISFDIVVLSPDPPSPAMTRLLSNVVYATKTTFLKGSLVHDVDRKRTQLASAEAVFVLADKDARATEAQDATTLLQALSIRNYADRYKDTSRNGG